jgi:CBS domain-containing protein
MQVRDIMTENPACCTPDTSLKQVALMMVEHDCGEIPVVGSGDRRTLVGVITDRDICCRAVAEGRDPATTAAGECMSSPVVTVTPETDVADCCQTMEANMIRRIPVVDARSGFCCGIVSQADIAERASQKQAGEVVVEVSRPTDAASRVGAF